MEETLQKTTKDFKKKFSSWYFLIAVFLFFSVVLGLLLALFSPTQIGPNGILLFFIILYILSFLFFFMGIKGLKSIHVMRSLSVQKSVYISAIIAFAPVLLLALQTIGHLEILDYFLLLVFEALAVFYIWRRLN